jgi:hypothetical protein
MISLHAGGVWHIIKKLLTKATTFLYTSYQLKVSSQSEACTQSYGPLKLRESQLWEFRDSHLGVPKQNEIWVLISWPGIEYTIRGKVVASPKFKPWWVLWVHVCLWFVSQPHFGQVWGWNSHSQSWGLGVLRDSWMFRVPQQRPKHLGLGCS